jgi:hypothetical protein
MVQKDLDRHPAGHVATSICPQPVGDGEDEPLATAVSGVVPWHGNAPPTEEVLVVGAHWSRLAAAGDLDRHAGC